ncbi:MAG TPA: hypothetical protein VE641_20210, partial [Chthoniobacterales bacterium]|nr:hypothetical protein [Chthoniobacterales bacterium]
KTRRAQDAIFKLGEIAPVLSRFGCGFSTDERPYPKQRYTGSTSTAAQIRRGKTLCKIGSHGRAETRRRYALTRPCSMSYQALRLAAT